MDYKSKIAEIIGLDGVDKTEITKSVARVFEEGMGDYCLPCFKFSKQLKMSPAKIAESLKTDIDNKRDLNRSGFSWLDRIEAVNGYLNFFLNKSECAASVLDEVYAKGELFVNKPSNGKTICIDFSSINIAKPFHIGHLLTTVIGGALYRVYEYLGYKVVGINHLGDWGTQFGKMIVAFRRWGGELDKSSLTVDVLSKLYVRFHQEAEADESLNDEARAWFKKLEEGDSEALMLFRIFKDITLKEVKSVYKMLGVQFDSYKGESFFNTKSRKIVDALSEKGLLVESDGASVVNLEADNMPPCLILKSDGTTLYATRDIATAIYRKDVYNFDKCLYVVAYQQELHFKQFFKVLEMMGYEWAKDCVHVPFGMVSLEGEGALSTRKGKVVYLRDVLETAIEKATATIDEKNPSLKNKAQTAAAIGVGAVIFGALINNRIKDMEFSYDRALNFDGETAPYIQYTHARCCSVLEKAVKIFEREDENLLLKKDSKSTRLRLSVRELTVSSMVGINYEGVNCSLIDDAQSFNVVKLLNEFENVVFEAGERYEPSLISKYLIDLAQAYNKFYMDNRIITEDTYVTLARLYLTECVRNTLKNGLSLLMIQAPDRM